MDLNMLNQIGHLVLTVAGIITAVVGALAGTKFGQSKAARTAAQIADLLERAADAAVAATEQVYAKQPLPEGGKEALREIKADEAVERARALLPAGVTATNAQLDTAIEAAVRRMNDAKGGGVVALRARVP